MENLHDRQECRQIPAGFVIIVITFSSVPALGRFQFHINKKTRKTRKDLLSGRGRGKSTHSSGLSFASKRSGSVVGKTQSRQSWMVCKVGRRFYTQSVTLLYFAMQIQTIFLLTHAFHSHYKSFTVHRRSTRAKGLRRRRGEESFGESP